MTTEDSYKGGHQEGFHQGGDCGRRGSGHRQLPLPCIDIHGSNPCRCELSERSAGAHLCAGRHVCEIANAETRSKENAEKKCKQDASSRMD
jgi:hypothetical protein